MADTTKTTSADALGLDAQAEMLKTERRANNVWNKLKRNKTAMIGLVIVVVMVFIAVFAPVLAPYDPDEIHPLDAFLKPFSEGHIFGTDQFGRDLLSRVIYGARVSLIVAAGGTFVGGIIGVLLGLIAGHGRYCRLCDHANHGWFSLLPICTVIHYSDDCTGTGTDQCYHRHRYRQYSKLCPCGSW